MWLTPVYRHGSGTFYGRISRHKTPITPPPKKSIAGHQRPTTKNSQRIN